MTLNQNSVKGYTPNHKSFRSAMFWYKRTAKKCRYTPQLVLQCLDESSNFFNQVVAMLQKHKR